MQFNVIRHCGVGPDDTNIVFELDILHVMAQFWVAGLSNTLMTAGLIQGSRSSGEA